MPIRVLQVVPSLNKGSGVTNFVMNVFRNIDQEKVQFDFLYFYNLQEEYKSEIECLGGRTYFIPMLNAYNIISFFLKVKAFFSEHKNEYKVMHLHEVLIGFVILPLAKFAGIKTRVVHSHNSEASEKKMKAFRNNCLCLSLKSQATVFFACSRKAGVFLYGEKWINKFIVVNNALDCKKYVYCPSIRGEVRKEFSLENKFVVGHIGRFCTQKNQLFFVDLLQYASKKIPNLCLLMVGDGPMRFEVERQIELLGLTSYVRFLGTRSDVNRILQAMDVFVLPSLFEGLPIVGVEAQAAGLPCVISDTVTCELKITDYVSFLNLQNETMIWVNKIYEVGCNSQRKDTSNILKRKGFDIHEQVQSLENFYLSNSH